MGSGAVLMALDRLVRSWRRGEPRFEGLASTCIMEDLGVMVICLIWLSAGCTRVAFLDLVWTCNAMPTSSACAGEDVSDRGFFMLDLRGAGRDADGDGKSCKGVELEAVEVDEDMVPDR